MPLALPPELLPMLPDVPEIVPPLAPPLPMVPALEPVEPAVLAPAPALAPALAPEPPDPGAALEFDPFVPPCANALAAKMTATEATVPNKICLMISPCELREGPTRVPGYGSVERSKTISCFAIEPTLVRSNNHHHYRRIQRSGCGAVVNREHASSLRAGCASRATRPLNKNPL